MANIAVINAIAISPFAFAPIDGGKDAFDRVLDFSLRLPDIDKVYLFTDSTHAEEAARQRADRLEVEILTRHADWDVVRLFGELQAVSAGSSDLFYFYADCPLLSPAITERMYASHRQYFSEYTFADGYPLGMTPEILQVERIPAMARLVRESDKTIERDTIFTTLSRDINAFDIETEISPEDLRLLRVQLYCDSLRNFRLTSGIINAGGTDEASILSLVETRQELLRTAPAYFEIQITEAVSQLVSYSPYPKLAGEVLHRGREMGLDQFRSLVDGAEQLAEDAVVSISLWGEPALHSRVREMVEEVLKHGKLTVLIETSGVGWKEGVLEAIAQLDVTRIIWIVDLDASTKELYESIRGPGWDEARETCSKLIDLFPGRVHVQAVRMQENEADLEGFYKYWKERTSNVIIQKYDWFCGYLPQKKVTDLSPLKRLPCWHLKRDMVILIDGSVPMCREDLTGQHVLGNAFVRPLDELWSRGAANYLKHVREDYPDLCKGCDEYYTYNF